MPQPKMPVWYGDDGEIVSCTEKIKVMEQNMGELFQAAQDAFEDERQLREYLAALMAAVDNPYRKKP